MDEEQRRQVMEALRRVARGEPAADGRDVETPPMRIVVGAMAGRRLELTVLMEGADGARRRLVLARGCARVIVTLDTRGERLFSYGELRLEAPDRTAGAAFAEAVACWLGAPLSTRLPGAVTATPPAPIVGHWVRLTRQRDADGVEWEVLKLFTGEGPGQAELFLRLGGGRAVLSEKWSAYRQAWIGLVERAFGHGRMVEPRVRVAIGERAALGIPPDWLVIDEDGQRHITDAEDRAAIDVSWLPIGAELGAPPAAERLRIVVGADRHPIGAITTFDRGDVDVAWAEYEAPASDTKGGPRRTARHRWLIAVGELGQVLATCAYWPDDAAWLVPAWERIIATLEVA